MWLPGIIKDDNGDQGYLMNILCDILQIVISSPTITIGAALLPALFISDVLLSFGM